MQSQSNGLDPTQPDPGVVSNVAPHAFLLFAAVLSIFLARRDRKLWKPVAVFVGLMALASLVGWGLVTLLPAWTPTRPAFVGWTRAIFHASQACRLAGPILLYGFSWWAFFDAPSLARPDGLAPLVSRSHPTRDLVERLTSFWLGALGVCVLGYPSIMRGDPLASIDPLRLLYAIVDVVAVVGSERLAARWLRARDWRDLLRWSAAPIWIVLMLIVGSAILLVFGPYRLGLWGHVYRVEQAGLVPLWGLVCGVLGTCLLRRRPAP